MAWVPSDYWIVCLHCHSRVLRSEAVRDRTGLLTHKRCQDLKSDLERPLPIIRDRGLDPRLISAPTTDVFLGGAAGGAWGSNPQIWGTYTSTWGSAS